MLKCLIHEPLAREIGQPLLTLSNLNKIDLIWLSLDVEELNNLMTSWLAIENNNSRAALAK